MQPHEPTRPVQTATAWDRILPDGGGPVTFSYRGVGPGKPGLHPLL